MSLVQQYRNYAAECLRVAKHTTNPSDKLLLLQMAETWRGLAERTEKLHGGIFEGDGKDF